MAENNNLVLKKISDIADFHFFIPSFQRGYRWDIMQVEDLLNDIKEYIDNKEKNESFLCLQPVVVYEKEDTSNNQNKNQYEKDKAFAVIDGQQRLTTIGIIKYYLSEHNKQLKQFDYNIEYEKYLKEKGEKTLSDLLSKMENFVNSDDFEGFLKQDDIDYNTALISLTNETIGQIYLTQDNKSETNKAIGQTYLTQDDKSETNKKCSPDEYHIILSYLVIVYYFNKNHEYIDKFIELFKSSNDNHSIQFIWYDVTNEIKDDEKQAIDDKKAIDIFTRLNIGKIPLTDAELIKALFLKKDNFKNSEIDKKLHIAYKWDEIEKTLNNDTFWYFISNKNEKEIDKRSRIELILELAIEKQNDKNHKLFKEYENKLKENKDHINVLDELWQKIEECFMTLKEWYNDNEMYHYIGYLTCNKKYVKDIYNLSKKNKKVYISELYNMIWNIIFKKDAKNINESDEIKSIINELNYDSDKIKSMINELNYDSDEIKSMINELNYNSGNIKEVLLFSNIYTTIKINKQKNSENYTNTILINRFPFHLYIKEKWDIEHISPQTDNPLNSIKERIIWFIESYKYLKINFDEEFYNFLQRNNMDEEKTKTLCNNLQSEKLENLITLYDSQKDTIKDNDKKNIIFENENWNLIYLYMFDYAEKNYKDILLTDDEKNKLGNLVLLPSDINRAYKNALFGVKRKHIIDDEQNNRFIPIDTKHVFLKYYSKNTIDLWVKDDLNDYTNTIISNINQFFKDIIAKILLIWVKDDLNDYTNIIISDINQFFKDIKDIKKVHNDEH